jgi:hypothetical protein
MTLDEFLDKYIDGYLLEDLRSLREKIPMPHDRPYGAVGYPIVLACLAGVESLGGLSSPKTYSFWDGEQYFKEAWARWLYPDRTDGDQLTAVVRKLIRNGIAHAYLTRTGVLIARDPADEAYHLSLGREGLLLHADVLARDVEHACKRFRDQVRRDAAFRERATERMRDLVDKSQKQATEILVPLFDAVGPSAMPRRTPFLRPSGIAMPECNSIVGPIHYSGRTDSPPGIGGPHLFLNDSTDSTGD